MERLVLGIVEDINDIREYYVECLKKENVFISVNGWDSMEAFIECQEKYPIPDIILSDINLPGMNGIEGIRKIKQKYPYANIIMLTVLCDSERIFQALCAGATGYILKDTPITKMKDAILQVQSGGSFMSPSVARKVIQYFSPKKLSSNRLTPREGQIVRAIVDGLSYKMVANKMGITEDTVRFHIKNIYRKLQVNSKSQVVIKYFKGEI